MILHLIFLLTYLVLGNTIPPTAMLSIAIAESLLAIFLKVRRGDNYLVPYVVAIALLITNNYGNILLITRLNDSSDIMYTFTVAEYIPEAVVIWCSGCSIFFFGYLFFEKKNVPPVDIIVSQEQARSLFFTMLVVVVFSQTIFSSISFLGSLSKLIGLLASIGVLFFAKLWASEDSKKYRNYAFILWAIQTYNALFHSYLRFETVTPSVIMAIGYFAGKRKIKYLMSYRIIPLVVILGLFINIFAQLATYRSNFASGIEEIYFGSIDDESSLDAYATNVERGGMFDRASTLGQITAVIKLVKDNGFYDGRASAPLFQALIPRFLWPDKPKIAIGQWFAVETGTAFIQEGRTTANNSINMTIPGELYLDFGWIGIFIGCFLFGGFIVLMWNSAQFYVSDYNITGAIWGGFLLYSSISGISGDLQIMITMLSYYLIFFTLKKII